MRVHANAQVATTGASFSVHGSSGASTTAAIRPPVANINLAELARWATGTSPTLQVAGEAAEGTQPVSRSLGVRGLPWCLDACHMRAMPLRSCVLASSLCCIAATLFTHAC